jgi:thioredoxin reductase (NADPH)
MTEVTGIVDNNGVLSVSCEDGDYIAKSVIIATGSKHRQLGLDNEEEFIGNGISFCAVCDGAFYAGKTVAVIGGGNSALVEAVMLSDTCAKLYIVQNLDFLTGEEKLANILKSKDNVEIIYGTVVEALVGSEELEAIILKNEKTGEKTRLDIDGMFIAIGQVPENEIFRDVTEINDRGYIVSDEACLTKTAGLFVAGDCRTKAIRQISTACSDGAIAALAAIRYLEN